MADGFELMVDSARAFFTELEQNNSKDWFAPRKDAYTNDIKKPAELLGDLIAEDLSRLTGRGHKPKLFRIYRDVRFSKDKTPLNAHLHVMWSDPAGGALTPAFFFGLSPSYFLMGTGIMGLQGEALTRFRAHVDRDGDTLQDALDTATTKGVTFSDWGPDPLKRVPKPYDADHPHADLLKRKSLAVHAPIPDTWRADGLVKAINRRIADLSPVAKALTPD
jgi:uncharacterized protein (TIGR02453 family)